MIAYAILYALTFRSLSLAQPELKPSKIERVWLLAFLLCFLYAVSDEVHQASTPSRTPSLEMLAMICSACLWHFETL